MTNTTRVLVTGATGKTGRRVTAILRGRGEPVRDASRTGGTPFDWTDLTTWHAALTDIAAVYIVTPDITDPAVVDQFRAFGQQAVSAGVTRATLLSVPHTGPVDTSPTAAAEEELAKTGLGLTILRLRWFHQNFSEDFLTPAVIAGDLRLPAGDGREAFVDADDIAEVVARTLTDNSHVGRSYELTGPRLLSFTDIAHELTKATGRTITYTPLTTEEYIAEQIDAGTPEEWARLSAHLYQGIASKALETTTTDIEQILGRPARDFTDYAAHTVTQGTWVQRC
ncbi:Rossmann-fold NAD(P)-binding domain-containing protein [Rhodococcus wratislaviensis]|uniref:NmrA family transcriptional regulator n=1 Tax=Rhodococcus wratislaviensis TaxID=44752 RepID=UPI0036687246